MIVGKTVKERKQSLAEIVKKHLNDLGKKAELVFNRVNSAGHRDSVLVESNIGLVHISATSSKDPNEPLLPLNFSRKPQDFLFDKDYVAFGWHTKDNRMLLIFLRSSDVLGKSSITKDEACRIRVKNLSRVFRL